MLSKKGCGKLGGNDRQRSPFYSPTRFTKVFRSPSHREMRPWLVGPDVFLAAGVTQTTNYRHDESDTLEM